MLGAWHTAAELVRKDLIKHFYAEKCQLVKIATVCRKELGSLKLLSGKFLWRVCTRTGGCVCDPLLAWCKEDAFSVEEMAFPLGWKAGLV